MAEKSFGRYAFVGKTNFNSFSYCCDSQAVIKIAKNSVYIEKERHIRIRHGAFKRLLKLGVISLEYARSERNLADPMTKGLKLK